MNPQQFLSARKDHQLVVLEGFHALKHALRFEAGVVDIITANKGELVRLTKRLAPDILAVIKQEAREVNADEFGRSSPIPIKSGVLAVAVPVVYDENIIESTNKTVVWLDNPKNHQNVGAVVRLAAGIGAVPVAIHGDLDIWNPAVLRGSAGLHYATAVIKTDKLPNEFGKKVYVFDGSGKPFEQVNITANSILVFGGERGGVSEPIKSQADEVVRIPMKKGVSSLNLATAVAIGLYAVTRRPR